MENAFKLSWKKHFPPGKSVRVLMVCVALVAFGLAGTRAWQRRQEALSYYRQQAESYANLETIMLTFIAIRNEHKQLYSGDPRALRDIDESIRSAIPQAQKLTRLRKHYTQAAAGYSWWIFAPHPPGNLAVGE